MGFLVIFIQKAIGQGIGILYGALGEIMTEKSGNLNLGIPGMMYMGGIAGLIGAFLYENSVETPNGFVGLLISFFCAFACAALGGLVYSVLTITLRANQNVTGLALTTFGVGFGNFFGGSLAGVLEKLDYLKELGVDTLYFCPVFEGAENHRYGTGDYEKIDPMLGTEADFRALRSIIVREKERLALRHAEFAFCGLHDRLSAPVQPHARPDAQEHALWQEAGSERRIVQHKLRTELRGKPFARFVRQLRRVTNLFSRKAAALRVCQLCRRCTFDAAAALAQNREDGGIRIPPQREPEREARVPRKSRAGHCRVLPQARFVIHVKRRPDAFCRLPERPRRQEHLAAHRLSRRLFS